MLVKMEGVVRKECLIVDGKGDSIMGVDMEGGKLCECRGMCVLEFDREMIGVDVVEVIGYWVEGDEIVKLIGGDMWMMLGGELYELVMDRIESYRNVVSCN